MLHKAWNSKEEMPYCFPRSSIKFQGHTGQNITDFDPNWTFPDYRPVAAFKSLINQSIKSSFVKGAGAHPQNAPCRRRSHALKKAPVRRGRLLSTVFHRWSPRQSILSAGVRRYFHPHDIFTPGENIVTIFSPPLRYFHPLTISNGKSFCSQIPLNFIMCIYNKEPFLYFLFYDFLQIFVHHRPLIQSINISTTTLSFNSKEGIMLKYNHFNPPSFMGWIYGY